jgi:hypothetical protein
VEGQALWALVCLVKGVWNVLQATVGTVKGLQAEERDDQL